MSQVRNKPESAATTAELLEILGVGRTTFYRYIERGILLPPEGYTAKFGRQALSILTVSDHLLTGEVTTSEERQTTFNDMIVVALDAAIQE